MNKIISEIVVELGQLGKREMNKLRKEHNKEIEYHRNYLDALDEILDMRQEVKAEKCRHRFIDVTEEDTHAAWSHRWPVVGYSCEKCGFYESK